MPSRAVEAALLLSVTMAATVLAFTVLRPLLFPRRATSVEVLKANLLSLAMLLDRGSGGMRLQTKYAFKSSAYILRFTIRTYEEGATLPSWSFDYNVPLPAAIVQLDEFGATGLFYGDPEPYANATASTLVFIEKDQGVILLRPAIQVEECSFYFYKCKRLSVQIPTLTIEIGGKLLSENTFAGGQNIEVFLNLSSVYTELKYCQKLELIVELLTSEGRIVELLGIPMRRQLTIDHGENGIILIQYVVKKVIVRT
ncbi:MAG: hypothetical protein QW096_09340 [Thermofilaceae archaeon]